MARIKVKRKKPTADDVLDQHHAALVKRYGKEAIRAGGHRFAVRINDNSVTSEVYGHGYFTTYHRGFKVTKHVAKDKL